MKTSRWSWLIALIGVLVLAGCSTPETRINKNPAAYERLTSEQQQLVRDGRVAIGFDRETVKLALGDPDRIWKRTDKSGESEAWTYTAYETSTGAPLYRGYWHRYYAHSPMDYPYFGAYAGVRKDREIFKVVFEGDAVVSVESES